MKTIAVTEENHRELVNLKLQEGDKQVNNLISRLISEHKQRKFLEAGELFRKVLKEKGISFKELLKRSRKIREEIADEWFQN